MVMSICYYSFIILFFTSDQVIVPSARPRRLSDMQQMPNATQPIPNASSFFIFSPTNRSIDFSHHTTRTSCVFLSSFEQPFNVLLYVEKSFGEMYLLGIPTISRTFLLKFFSKFPIQIERPRVKALCKYKSKS